jgi:DNA-binding beta-propeller fold protein YncE
MDRLERTLSFSSRAARGLAAALAGVLLGGWLTAAQAEDSLVGFLSTHAPAVSASTVPARGDLNPYGVAFVPEEFPEGGPASAGDVLVANFNGPGNAQGTGTTVVRITPAGGLSTFFAGRSGLGLSTALWVLKRGFVLVGNVPSTDGLGICTTGPGGEEQGVGQGSLLVLNRHGHLVKELKSAEFLDGPWDLTVRDEGSRAQVFVSSVLNGTVSRIDLAIDGEHQGDGERARHDGEGAGVQVLAMTRIGSGYQHRCDPAAFVVGPTGLTLDTDQDVLYVAATADNAIYAIRAPRTRASDAGLGELVTADAVHLHGPVGLVLAPNGDIVTTQGDAVNPDPAHPSEIVEFTASGRFVAEFSIDPSPGSAFGMALEQRDDRVRFAAVDDGLNVLDIWTVAGEGGRGEHLAVRKAAMVATTTVLTPSAMSITSGTMISLSASVTGASPTGNVSFYDGTTLLGSAALASGKAMMASVSLAVGSHNLSAIYAGDANNSGSTSAVVVVTVSACTYGCAMGGGGGGGYGGGAFGATELALLVLGAAARRRRPRQRAGWIS